MNRRRSLPLWTAPILVFLLLGTMILLTKAPWCDEGWFACPAHQMAFHGNDGTPVLEPTGHYLDRTLTGIQQRTLVIPPMHLWLLAGWYKLWGPGLNTPRSWGLLWGAAGLIVLGSLVQWAWRRTGLTLLFVSLMSIDLTYLWSSADTRMDIQTAVLTWAAWLSYLTLRKRSFTQALLASQCCFAFAALHHPNAAYGALNLGLLILYLDRKKLALRPVALAALPYLAAAAAWAFYISPDWQLFQIQFGANAAGYGGNRSKYSLQPIDLLWLEIAIRYIAAYGVKSMWFDAVPDLLRAVPFLYFAVLLLAIFTGKRRLRGRGGALAVLTLTQLLIFTFLMSFKAQNYLVFLAPFWNLWLAKLIWEFWRKSSYWRVTAALMASLFAAAHLGAIQFKVRESMRTNGFDRARRAIASLKRPSETLWAPTYWGVNDDFSGYREDIRLGFHTGQRRDWIVMDHWNSNFDIFFAQQEPQVAAHVNHLLKEEYTLAATFGEYRLYRRKYPTK